METDARFDLNATTQRWFLALGLLIVPMLLLGIVLGHQFPPTSPSASAVQIARLNTNHQTEIQIGCLIMMVGFSFMGLWGGVLTVWIWRMESHRFPVLTLSSAILGGCSSVFAILGTMCWAVAAYRPGVTSPDITRMLNDFGWFAQLYTWPPFLLWNLCFAIAVYRDTNTPRIFPRWVMWATVATMISYLPAGLMGFVTSGPFSYDGFLSFWVAVGAFLVWNLIVDRYIWKAIKDAEARIGRQPQSQDTAIAVPVPN